MSNEPGPSTRRAFLSHKLQLGAGSLLIGSALRADAADENISPLITLPELPTRVLIEEAGRLKTADRQGSRFTSSGATVTVNASTAGHDIRVACPGGPLSRIVLRWEITLPGDTLYLGDHWERGYGDLEWRFLQPERVMPWYFAAHHAASGRTAMLGVKTQPAAMCFWTVDGAGVSLWLDLRNGGSPSLPGEREIAAAFVVSLAAHQQESPLAALTRFCRVLCPDPRLPAGPICGNNNWYYAYGRNFDANATLRDASFLAEVASGQATRPYSVIDAGWGPDRSSVCPGGPWDRGDPKRFPDMPGLAAAVKQLGVRPGIWIRPTALSEVDNPKRLRPGPSNAPEKPLDLTLAENLAFIHDDVARVHSWGFDLIKHDFSTYDVFGRWGFEMGAELTDSGWHFNDRSLTNAEIILRLYRTLRTAAGEAVLLGCNTVGHLGAGLFEVQRTGDDTSGRVWERTRRMGINTLAFRLPQHGTFFISDPDCAAHTPDTPWEFDHRYLDLVARSGAALFISVDPRTIEPAQKAAFRSAMQLALGGGSGHAEPLDWLHTTAPRAWRFGDEKVTYAWEEPAGANPLRV